MGEGRGGGRDTNSKKRMPLHGLERGLMLAARRKWAKRSNGGKSGSNAARSTAGSACHNGKCSRAKASGAASSRSIRGISLGNDAVASSVAANVAKPLAPLTGARAFCNSATSAGCGAESVPINMARVRIGANMVMPGVRCGRVIGVYSHPPKVSDKARRRRQYAVVRRGDATLYRAL